MSCLDCCLTFLVFASSRSTEHELKIKIDNTDDQYLSIDGQVKKKNPRYLFKLGIEEQGKHNLVHMVLKYFNFWLLHIAYDSNVFTDS
jgi:hypothetical protein